MLSIDEILQSAPDNFVIQSALIRCFEVMESHSSVAVSVSGGSDSDVMLDMILRCGGRDKCTFVFFNTGLEYEATLEHLDYLEQKYGIQIIREKAVKSIPYCVKTYGVPFYSKFGAEMMYRLQRHNFQWEDEPFEVLIRRYPKCKTALEWWCNVKKGNTTQYIIDRYPYLKEFIMSSPPQEPPTNAVSTPRSRSSRSSSPRATMTYPAMA